VVKYWLAVACAEHVRRGRAGGFAQVCHGKGTPLRRMNPGDGIVYYSPSRKMGEKDGYQSFTAIGTIRAREPYQVEQFPGFTPYRRDIDWMDAEPHPIKPLLDWLDFTRARNWGYALRLGVIEIPAVDFEFLQHVMTQAKVAA